MYLVVGLGNPGIKFEQTRHNIGYMVVDRFIRDHKISMGENRLYWKGSVQIQNQHITLLKPKTYMNLSGGAVASYLNNHNINLSNILIICDDINLPFGVIRIRPKGSDGGQKGLRSIITSLGTQEIPRLRLGIGDDFDDAVEYVLSPFRKSEITNLTLIINVAVEAIEYFVLHGIESAMNKFNRNYLKVN